MSAQEAVSIGVDLGGTHIKYAVIRVQGDILWEGSRPTRSGVSKKAVLENVIACVEEAKNQASEAGYTPLCAGVGTPGLVDVEKGLVRGGAFQLPDWNNVPLRDIVSNATGLPVFVDNDANMMGLGECVYGSVGKCRNMIFLTIGTGIGGAIIINEELYRGHNYAGSELGCFMMFFEGKTAYWEDFASTEAMIQRYRQKAGDVPDKETINGHYIFEKYRANNPVAVDVVDENTHLIGLGVAGYLNIFNPEMVVIGGGISEAGEFYIDKIRKVALKYAMKECSEGVKIRAASLGNKAGFLGAGYFAMKQLKVKK